MPKDETDVQEPEDDGLAKIEESLKGSPLDEDTIKKLIAENPDSAGDIITKFLRNRDEATSALVNRERSRDLREYKIKLAEEFPYADLDSIEGASKKQLRASAERQHKHTERILKAAGIKPGEQARDDGVTRDENQWGSAPAGATEVVKDSPSMAWSALQASAANARGPQGDAEKRKVLDNLKQEGFRTIDRPTLATALKRRKAS